MADDIIDDLPPRTTSRSVINGQSHQSRPNGSSSGPRITANPDRSVSSNTSTSAVVQPKPQALPKRSGPASIIVSPRQKGNPVLNAIKSMPWEYGDIPADYVLGATTCALFLSLKYHRLHPEYIYTRIRNLQGKYALRIILVMVDIQNHEDSLKELSKTSLINNVTLILCWSAAEGGRYLELFKTFENAAPTSIRQHQSTSYSDRLVDFVTTPRSINKTDAVSLVSQFGTIRTAVNARHEDIATIAGWGEKKVQRWCAAVRDPFRIKRAARRDLSTQDSASLSRDGTRAESDSPRPASAGFNTTPLLGSVAPQDGSRAVSATGMADADRRPRSRLAEEFPVEAAAAEEAVAEALTGLPFPPAPTVQSAQITPNKRKANDDPVSEGVMEALSKLRKNK